MSVILRPDQQQLKYDIYSGWNAGHKNMLGVASTGFGKSVVFSDIINDYNNLDARQVVIAHRNELVSQMSHHIARRGIYHRIIGSNETMRQIIASHRKTFGQSFVHPTANCSVAGIDTINSRADDLKQWAAQIDRWYLDECHHLLVKNKWGRGVALFGNALGLGMTATPGRPDGQGLGRLHDGLIDEMVFAPEMRTLINMGALCDYEIVCPASDLQIDDSAITDSGDYSPKKLKAAAEKSRIVGDVVTNYVKYAIGKRAICFATDIETAGKIASQFNAAGIRAASVSSHTPPTVREKYTEDFKSGLLTILVNVDLFDEGFDTPDCECVIMARPTASIVKYLQQFGRALRVAAGKAYGLIIDHVSNVLRHGLPDKPREWSLSRREKRAKQEKDPEEIPLIRCMSCAKPYERFRPCCPYCGWEPPLPEPGARTIEQVDGDLVLLDRAALEAKRRAMTLEDAGSMAQRVAAVAGPAAGGHAGNKQMAKIAAHKRLSDAIAQWAGIQRAMGRDDRESYRRFYLTMGCDVMDALRADRDRQEFETMTETVRGWIRKRGYAV